MNMKDLYVPNAIFQWTAMVLGQLNLTNGKAYVKNSISAQNAEKHILQVWKIS